jgi:hypothetical protein
MTYRDELPQNCPPLCAREIQEPCQVYRLVRSNLATASDFLSERALCPERTFHVSECQARGLSVFLEADDCMKVRKLPSFRNKPQCRVCRITLGPGAGSLLQTGQWSHHTWWPYAAYDVLQGCEVMDQ